VTVEHALTLLLAFLQAAIVLIGPVLAVAAVIGTLTGVIQTATQINEPSIAYAAKVLGIVVLLLFAGPAMIDKALSYTKTCFGDVARVVR
jgi:flagellar biosynthesis protein FliQ